MESNKLLIGVQFVDPRNNNKSLVFELIVLRDLTLRQLIDGIKYGLIKKGEDKFYKRCREIFNECVSVTDAGGLYKRITLTSYNDALLSEKVNGVRAAIRESDMKKTLVEAGFISATRIVFDPTESYRSYEINTSVIIPAFNHAQNGKDGFSLHDYNISTRQLSRFDDTPVEIIPPSNPPQKPEQNILMMLLPTVITISVTIISRIMTLYRFRKIQNTFT